LTVKDVKKKRFCDTPEKTSALRRPERLSLMPRTHHPEAKIQDYSLHRNVEMDVVKAHLSNPRDGES
jgi:hypothetical protein